MTKEELAEGVTIYLGDCLEALPCMEENCVDSIVTDPPYHLTSIVKRFGADDAAPAKVGKTGAYARASAGFMGKKWDGGGVAFDPDTWRLVFRVLKPGGHLVAFAGTRTYHRMTCAIEDAGFEIRDQLGFCYGSGFPKSHNISRAVCRCSCEAVSERDVRPVQQADVSEARSDGEERRQVLFAGLPERSPHRTMQGQNSGEGIAGREQPGLEGRGDLPEAPRQLRERPLRAMPARSNLNGANGRLRDGTSLGDGALGRQGADADGVRASHRPQAAQQSAAESGTLALQSESQAGGTWPLCNRCGKPNIPDGLGTALKPAWEPICLARKPLGKNTVAENVQQFGTGALNIDGCRVAGEVPRTIQGQANSAGTIYGSDQRTLREFEPHTNGRWPANIVHDGSDEVVAAFPESKDGVAVQRNGGGQKIGNTVYSGSGGGIARPDVGYGSEGSAARFFASFPRENDAWNQRVNDAARCSLQCRPQSGVIAQSNAGTSDALRIAQNVKCAAILCDSCAMAIARALAEVRQSGSAESLVFKCSIDEYKKTILTQSLVRYVAHRENTDTILTIESLRELFGSVFHAIAESTSSAKSAASTKSAPKRLWYSAKADSDDRIGSKHPTVKPIDLMQWLVRLVTPPGGLVLDPFAGTGTTAEAAFREGMRAVLIEREEEYQADIRRRMALVLAGPEERRRESIKASGKTADAGPLFAKSEWETMWKEPWIPAE